MTIQVTFTTEQFFKNADVIQGILGGEAATNTAADAKEPAKKAPAKKAPAKKAEPKVTQQMAEDVLTKIKDDKTLGLAECRNIMTKAGVPGTPPKMAAMTEEHWEKVVELGTLLLEGGGEEEELEEEELEEEEDL